MEQKKRGGRCWLQFTLLFAAAMSAVLFYFLYYKKSFVWDCDGLYQHFNCFVYYGKYLRSLIKNLWENHVFAMPMWDMSIGFGSDVLTTLNYYGFGDPLALLSVFAPAQKAEYLYGFLAVLRLYLAGCAFLYYCRRRKNGAWACVLGALCYCFCGFAVFVFARHPFFVNPMIYFPLLLAGMDKIFEGKRPRLFIWTAAVGIISNFYFAYMMCILMFFYALVRYAMLFGKTSVRAFFGWVLRFAGYFLTSLALSAVTLLPTAVYLLHADRMSADNDVPLFYPLSSYARLFSGFFRINYVSEQSRSYTILAMQPIVLIAVFVLFMKKKQFAHLKAGVLGLGAMFLLPWAGHVMNGFSYESNRWVWGLVLLLSYLVVKMYPLLLKLTEKEGRRLFLACALFSAAALLLPGGLSGHVPAALALLMVLAGAAAAKSPLVKKTLPALFFALTLAGIGLNAWDLYAPGQTGYINEFRAQGKPYALLTSGSVYYPVKKLKDNSAFYRSDQYGEVSHENTAMQTGLYNTDFYFSVPNGAVNRFYEALFVCVRVEQMRDHLDARSILDRLAAVKYFVVKKKGGTAFLPYSYDKKAAKNKNYAVYESDEILPFGYTYDSYIPQEAFDAFPVERRQQALLQGVVAKAANLPKAELSFAEEKPQITVTPGDGVSAEGNRFAVTQSNAEIAIEFTGTPDSETYLVLKDLSYEGSASHYTLRVSADEAAKSVPVYTPKDNFYSGKDDFAANLGYAKEGRTKITLRFSHAGVYTAQEFYVFCQPMEQTDGQVRRLRADTLQDVQFSDNRVSGTISLQEPKFLVLSMAYSDGWKAYVDGDERELQCANLMYAGLELESGEHEVTLVYETPYLRIGAYLSLLGLLMTVFLSVRYRIKRK